MGERSVVTLVPDAVSQETIKTLELLLRDARNGQVIGVAYICMHKGYQYSVNIAGETRRSPTLTRGILTVLDDQLSKIIGSK